MHRFGLIIAVLSLFAVVACSDDAVTGERGLESPTAAPADPIAGEMTDGFAPNVDDRVAVVGVAVGGNLPMRVFPGLDQPVVARIPGTEGELYGFGQTFETEDGRTWWLVRWENSQGWIEPGAAYLGATADISVTIAGNLPASSFVSAAAVLDAVLLQLPPNPIIVEQLVDTTSGTATTTIDLLEPTETQRGRRVIITAAGADASWRLQSVQQIPLCTRGVDDAGTCT